MAIGACWATGTWAETPDAWATGSWADGASVPTNQSAEDALQIFTLPYTVSVNASGATGPQFDLWWSYTASTTEVIGVFGYADVASDYDPKTSIWLGPAAAPTSYLNIAGLDVPVQFQVNAGTTYYIRVRQFNAGVTPDTPLLLSVVAGTDLPAAPGSILINDDTGGFPGAIISQSTGDVLQFRPNMVAGEAGDVLPSGEVLLSDEFTTPQDLKLYQPSLESVVSVAFTADGIPRIRTHNPSGSWYVGDSGVGATPARATRLSADGTFGPITWTMPVSGMEGLAANNAETILYYTGAVSSLNTPVSRWDLVNNTALSDLAGAVVGYVSGDVLVLDDDSIVVVYREFAFPYAAIAKRYSPAGVTLNTYTFLAQGVATPIHRLAYSLSAGTFWVYFQDPASLGSAHVQQINASDGSIIVELRPPVFTAGIYQGDPASDAPRFGVSHSCPFVVLRSLVAPIYPPPPPYPPSPSGRGSGRSLIIRRLRRAPHLSREQLWNFYHLLQLDLETGVGLSDGQGADPQIMLRWSDDGGHTWSDEYWVSAGRQGQYKARAMFRRLGRSRDRIFEVVVSDPVRWNLIAAYLDVTAGES